METWLTRTLGIDVPLIQAPMAGVSEGLLAGAVSKAGGLGMIGIGPHESRAYVEEQAVVAASAGRPYGIGLLAWALEQDPAPLEAALESDAALVSVSFGQLRRATAAAESGREARDDPGRQPRGGPPCRGGRGGLHRGARSRGGRPRARRARHPGLAPDRPRQRECPGRGRRWRRDRGRPLRRTRRRRVQAPGSGPPSFAAGKAQFPLPPANGCWPRTTRPRPTAESSMSPNVPPGRRSTADARCATGSSTSGSVVRTNWQQIRTHWMSTPPPGVAARTSTSRSSTPAKGLRSCGPRPLRPRWSPGSSPTCEGHSLAP